MSRLVLCRILSTTGGCRSLLEGLHVHPQLSAWAHNKRLVLANQVAGAHRRAGGEAPAESMESPSQIVRGCLPTRVGPQEVHNLFAVEAVTRSQGEQLY